MRSTPRNETITVSSVTGTVPPNGPHNQPGYPHDPNTTWHPQQQPEGAFYMNQLPPPPPRRGMSTGAILGIVGAIVAVLCIGATVAMALIPPPGEDKKPAAADGLGSPAPYDVDPGTYGSPSASSPVPSTAPASTAPAAGGPLTSFGDGTHEVGTGPGQIPPGTYTAVVPDQAFDFCMWTRLKGFSGEGRDVITFGTGNAGDKQRVTIAASDKGFETKGCGTWAKA